MTRTEVLTEANRVVTAERQNQYGEPEDNFTVIAKFWSAYLETSVTNEDVVNMMILLKVARNATGSGKDDNYIDIAGYAACGAELKARNKE